MDDIGMDLSNRGQLPTVRFRTPLSAVRSYISPNSPQKCGAIPLNCGFRVVSCKPEVEIALAVRSRKSPTAGREPMHKPRHMGQIIGTKYFDPGFVSDASRH